MSKYQKLVKMMVGKTRYFLPIPQYYWIMGELSVTIKKTNIKNDVCLHSEIKITLSQPCSFNKPNQPYSKIVWHLIVQPLIESLGYDL